MDANNTSEITSLQQKFAQEKKVVEDFLFSSVPPALLKMVEKTFRTVLEWEKTVRSQKQISEDDKSDLHNVGVLKKNLPSIPRLKYYQLLQVLFKFPKKFQMGLNDDLLQILAKQKSFQQVNSYIPIKNYAKKSLRLYLIDCTAFFYLRKEQSQAESLEKIKALEDSLAIIPNHFLLLEKLGGRGIISVHRGINLETNQTLVIKYLPEKEAALRKHKAEREKFAREVRSFAKLEQHRKAKIKRGERTVDSYFVKAYRLAKGKLQHMEISQAGELSRSHSETVQFMVMRYNEGPALKDLLVEYRQSQSKMAVKIAVHILKRLLEALDYCYKENIVHRDISPKNILLTKEFQVRLTNLGSSKLEDIAHLTQHGVYLGTASYAAPEAIYFHSEGNFENLMQQTDHRSDLYSVGCIAYEMLVGHPPFVSIKKEPDSHERDILEQHLHGKPVAPHKIREEVGKDLGLFIIKLLAKKPENRFATPRQALETLRNTLSLSQKAHEFKEDMTHANAPEKTQEFRLDLPQEERSPFFKALIAAVVLFVLAGGWYVWQYDLPRFLQPYWEHKKLSQSEKMLEKLQKQHQTLVSKWQNCQQLVTLLQEKYPAQEGYPSVSQRVLNTLEQKNEHIERLGKVIEEGKEKLKSNPKLAQEWFNNYHKEPASNQYTQEILQKIASKLAATKQAAEQLHQSREQEKTVRRTYRLLRIYVLRAQEAISLIEEKVAILEEEFPIQRGYLGVDPEVKKEVARIQELVANYQELIQKLQPAIENHNFNESYQWIQEYQEVSLSDLERLADLNESVEETLSVCENIRKNRQQRRIIDQGLTRLQQYHRQLAETYKSVQHHWQEMKQLSLELPDAQKLLRSVQTELEKTQKTISQVNQQLEENQEAKAMEQLQPYLQQKRHPLLLAIQALDEQLADRLSISQMPRVDEQQKQKLITLLNQSKQKLAKIQSSYQLLQDEYRDLKEEFPQEIPDKLVKLQKRVNSQTQNILGFLKNLIEKTEQKLTIPDLTSALKILQENHNKLQSFEGWSKKLLSLHGKILSYKEQLQQQQQQQHYRNQNARIRQKLQEYIQRVGNMIDPLRQEVLRMQEQYPAIKGFTQLDPEKLQVLDRAQQLLEKYQQSLTQSQQLQEQGQLDKAYQLLAPFAKRRLGYPEFVSELRALQEHVASTKAQLAIEEEKRQSREQVQQMLSTLQERNSKLEQVMTTIENKQQELALKYPASQGYYQVKGYLATYLQTAKLELADSKKVISQAQQLAKTGHWERLYQQLQPYVTHNGCSVLPLLEVLEQEYHKVLAKNKQLDRNPELKKQHQQQISQILNYEKQQQQWQQAPGKWYNQLQSTLKIYQALQNKFQSVSQDQWLKLLRHRIKLTIRKIEHGPKQMAELRLILALIPHQPEAKQRELQQYLETKEIALEISHLQQQLQQKLQSINQNLAIHWVEEDDLQDFLYTLSTISQQFDQAYLPIRKRLLEILYQ